MPRIVRAWMVVAALLVSVAPVKAIDPDERLDDPVLEQRARELAKDLRCVVCDNQSIDDSDADVAADMRALVRQRLLAGDTDQEIMDRMVSYYGEYVLLTPKLSLKNALIWLAPIGALMLCALWWFRRTRGDGAPGPMAVDGGVVAGVEGAVDGAPEGALTAPRPAPDAADKGLTAAEQARLDALLSGDYVSAGENPTAGAAPAAFGAAPLEADGAGDPSESRAIAFHAGVLGLGGLILYPLLIWAIARWSGPDGAFGVFADLLADQGLIGLIFVSIVNMAIVSVGYGAEVKFNLLRYLAGLAIVVGVLSQFALDGGSGEAFYIPLGGGLIGLALGSAAGVLGLALFGGEKPAGQSGS